MPHHRTSRAKGHISARRQPERAWTDALGFVGGGVEMGNEFRGDSVQRNFGAGQAKKFLRNM
jgi:hypothetical protein